MGKLACPPQTQPGIGGKREEPALWVGLGKEGSSHNTERCLAAPPQQLHATLDQKLYGKHRKAPTVPCSTHHVALGRGSLLHRVLKQDRSIRLREADSAGLTQPGQEAARRACERHDLASKGWVQGSDLERFEDDSEVPTEQETQGKARQTLPASFTGGPILSNSLHGTAGGVLAAGGLLVVRAGTCPHRPRIRSRKRIGVRCALPPSLNSSIKQFHTHNFFANEEIFLLLNPVFNQSLAMDFPE